MNTIANCIALVEQKFKYPRHRLLGNQQARDGLSQARHVGYWLALETTGQSLTAIARAFNRSDHKTIRYGIQRINNMRAADAAFRHMTDEMRYLLSPPVTVVRRGTAQRKLRVERTRLMFMAGMTDKEIARHLRVAKSTVQTYRKEVQAYHNPVTKAKAEASALTKLKCLGCGSPFLSVDKRANRMCNHCKSSREWNSGGDYSFESRL